jgi:hypothetical protein
MYQYQTSMPCKLLISLISYCSSLYSVSATRQNMLCTVCACWRYSWRMASLPTLKHPSKTTPGLNRLDTKAHQPDTVACDQNVPRLSQQDDRDVVSAGLRAHVGGAEICTAISFLLPCT